MDDIIKFLAALQEAEEKGEEDFVCPICGGSAYWGRSPGNNHLHCGCDDCGIRMIE